VEAAGGVTVARRGVPPERIQVGGLVLRRVTVDDAEALGEAINASIDHLAPWMPWAAPGEVSAESQRAWLSGPPGTWTEGGEYHFAAVVPGAGVVGCFGLNRRAGPGGLDVGYWVHAAHTGRGIATAAAGALTDAGFRLAGIDRMEIHCDAANRPSARVAAKLGYRLVRSVALAPSAPAETGTRSIWALERAEWLARRGSDGDVHVEHDEGPDQHREHG
jgi:RimJ/RimL family protein N-acetyltransferase